MKVSDATANDLRCQMLLVDLRRIMDEMKGAAFGAICLPGSETPLVSAGIVADWRKRIKEGITEYERATGTGSGNGR